jgi:hypothetical protein
MTWTLKAHASAFSVDGGGSATTGAVDTTGSDILFIGIVRLNSPVSNPVDSAGNTYVLVEDISGGAGEHAALYYASATTGSFATSASHTFTSTFAGSNNFPSMYAQAFSGSAASPVDQVNQSGQAGAVTSVQPGSVTPGQAGELIVTVVGINGTNTTGSVAVDSSFTITDVLAQTGVSYGGAMAYLVQGGAAAVNPTWSWTPACTDASSVIATFKGVGTGDVLYPQACM